MTREEARDRDEILQLVKTYYENHHQKAYQTGDRIVYAGRVYDEEELMMLVNSALDFWLTGGRYTIVSSRCSRIIWAFAIAFWLIQDRLLIYWPSCR